jgi:hypothetical protein
MKVKKAWLVSVDGTPLSPLTELEGKELSLKDMYPIIGNGCDIVQMVQLDKGVTMWVDEEGLLKDNVVKNEFATKLFNQKYALNNMLLDGDENSGTIVGNAIIIDNTKAGKFI